MEMNILDTDALAVLLFAALPIVELRGAIPFAIITLEMDVIRAVIYSIIGNMIPVFFLLTLLPMFERLGRRYSKLFDKAITWWFNRVQKKHEKTFLRWGALTLIILVAIPLPATGAWTGSVAAHLFKINTIPAFFYIAIGVIIAAGLVTLLTIGGTKLI